MKIGVVTIFGIPNYGAILQAYALSRYLQNLGHEVVLFDVEPKKKNPLFYVKDLLKLQFIRRFQQSYYPRVIKDLNEDVDLYMVGSDQVWNPDITRSNFDKYMLSFAKHGNRVSYAASLGITEWHDEEKRGRVNELLGAFRAIAVRESQGVQLLKNEFGIDAQQVLDPCFLLDPADYMFSKCGAQTNNLVSYKLRYNLPYSDALSQLSKDLGCKKLELKAPIIKSLPPMRDVNMSYPTVAKWVQSIASAKYVVTDSFHGTVFSLMFKRQFVVVPSIAGRSSRLESLLGLLGLQDRYLQSMDEVRDKLQQQIDYDEIYPRLEQLKERSRDILKSML